jgi:hypothetical protein
MCFLLVKALELDPNLGKLRIRILKKFRIRLELEFIKVLNLTHFSPNIMYQFEQDTEIQMCT